MKTIKIDEHAHAMLNAYKYFWECKTYSETIKKLYNYIEVYMEKIYKETNKKIFYED